MDARTVSRRFGAVCLVIGPLTSAIGTLFETDAQSTSAALTWEQQHLAVERAASFVGLGTLLLLPAMLYLMRLARRGSPRLALIGGGLSFLAWLAGIASVSQLDELLFQAAQLSDPTAAIPLLDAMNSHDPIINVLEAVFVIGHLVGMLLLGLALLRSRAVQAWAAVLVGVSPILHAGGMAFGPVADAATFGILAVGTTACGYRLLHLSDDEWDLPPLSPTDRRVAALPHDHVPA